MCVTSMIYDHYNDKYPFTVPQPYTPYVPLPSIPPTPTQWIFTPPLTAEEIADFRKDMIEMKKLLERAREYDRRTGQADCELAEKKDKIKKLAEALGVDVSFVDAK